MRRAASIAFLMHAACSSNASTPDASIADASTGGLIIEIVAKGGVPQMPDANVEITQVLIGISAMRAIGDAAPGDVRTTRTNLRDFVWNETDTPNPELFSMAPPGVYSTIELRIADTSVSSAALIIGGRATRGGNLFPFEIQSSTSDVSIPISVNTILPPRQLVTTTVAGDFAALVAGIDWETVPLTPDGRLFIGDGDPEMAAVIGRLPTVFAQQP